MTASVKKISTKIKLIGGIILLLSLTVIAFMNLTRDDAEEAIGIQPPTIHVVYGTNEINTAIQKVSWNGNTYEQSYPFKLVMSHQRVESLCSIPYGTEFEITFDGKAPESVTVYDMIVTDNGSLKYNEANTRCSVLKKDNNTYRYRIEQQGPEVGSKSNATDSENTLRGIMIEYIEGENQCWYGFVIRTQ